MKGSYQTFGLNNGPKALINKRGGSIVEYTFYAVHLQIQITGLQGSREYLSSRIGIGTGWLHSVHTDFVGYYSNVKANLCKLNL